MSHLPTDAHKRLDIPVRAAYGPDSLMVIREWINFLRSPQGKMCHEWIAQGQGDGALFHAFRAGLQTSAVPPAMTNTSETPCRGVSCGAKNGERHSDACLSEHEACASDTDGDAPSNASDAACAFTVWWPRFKSQATSPRKAAWAAWFEALDYAAKRAPQVEADTSATAYTPAPAGAVGAKAEPVARALDCLEILDKRPRPMCRDCADENGICPNSGLDCDMRELIGRARKALAHHLAQQPAQGAPSGWRLVPIEPTEAMLYQGHNQIDFDRTGQNTHELDHPSQHNRGIGTSIEQDMRDAWAAMLRAAPQIERTALYRRRPATHVMVPLRLTQAMRDVMDQDSWDWGELLAAAEAATEEECAIASESDAPQPAAPARGQLCTCDGAGRGPGRLCTIKSGGRLGDSWVCREAHEKAKG